MRTSRFTDEQIIVSVGDKAIAELARLSKRSAGDAFRAPTGRHARSNRNGPSPLLRRSRDEPRQRAPSGSIACSQRAL